MLITANELKPIPLFLVSERISCGNDVNSSVDFWKSSPVRLSRHRLFFVKRWIVYGFNFFNKYRYILYWFIPLLISLSCIFKLYISRDVSILSKFSKFLASSCFQYLLMIALMNLSLIKSPFHCYCCLQLSFILSPFL